MYAGRIVEYGAAEDIFNDPRHPYTRGLLSSIPDDASKEEDLTSIPGNVIDSASLPSGCHFANRCEHEVEKCERVDPRLGKVSEDHFSACIWEDPQ
jgi:oligopeptide/dipeptide ABC transporter ATP-binding protein